MTMVTSAKKPGGRGAKTEISVPGTTDITENSSPSCIAGLEMRF